MTSHIPFNAVKASLNSMMAGQPKLTSEFANLHNLLVFHYTHPAWELPEHSSPFPVLEVITGAPKASPHQRRMGDLTLSGALAGGEVFLCPPSADYAIRWEADLEFTLIGFQPHLWEAVLEGRSLEIPPLALASDPTVQTIISDIREDLAAGCPLGSIYSDSAALFLVIHLLKLLKTQPPTVKEYDRLGHPSLQAVLDYLHEHYTDPKAVRLDCLANIAHITQFHFHRLFKQTMGKTPKQYVLQLRIDRAMHLLRSTNQSLLQIAQACGFSRTSQLKKYFTQLVGTSSEQFRRSTQ